MKKLLLIHLKELIMQIPPKSCLIVIELFLWIDLDPLLHSR